MSEMQNYLAYSEETVDREFNTNYHGIVEAPNGEDLMKASESSYETLVKLKKLIDVVYMKPKQYYSSILDNSRLQTVYQTDSLSNGNSDEFWDITLVNIMLSVYEQHAMNAVMMLALSRYIDKAYGRDTMKMIREYLVS